MKSEVANTILAQLGGTGPLTAMIGAYNFMASAESLSFRFKSAATNKSNYVDIALDSSDTYTVKFYHMNRRFDVTKCGETSMIYADVLRKHIEDATGLRLSL